MLRGLSLFRAHHIAAGDNPVFFTRTNRFSMTVAFIRADALKALALHHQQKVSKQCDCTASACMGWDSVSDARWPQTQMQALATLRE